MVSAEATGMLTHAVAHPTSTSRTVRATTISLPRVAQRVVDDLDLPVVVGASLQRRSGPAAGDGPGGIGGVGRSWPVDGCVVRLLAGRRRACGGQRQRGDEPGQPSSACHWPASAELLDRTRTVTARMPHSAITRGAHNDGYWRRILPDMLRFIGSRITT